MAVINPSTSCKLETDCHIRFLEHCLFGGSIPEFCREERISRTTFDTWCIKYPHMKDARAMGKTWAEGWWMSEARKNLTTYSSKEESSKFDTSLYRFVVSGRFGHTSDRTFDERLKYLETLMAQQKPAATGQFAEEAAYELIDDNSKPE